MRNVNGIQIVRSSLYLIGLLLTMFSCHVNSTAHELPCDFLDSVNITKGISLVNKSIIFDDVEFDKNQYAEVDYILKEDKRIKVQPHIRGCLCNRKPCIRLCCPIGSIPETQNETQTCIPHESVISVDHPVLNQDNDSMSVVKLDDHFSIVDSRPCKYLYLADQSEYQITHKGQILHEDGTLDHQQYCVHAQLNKTTNAIDWNLLVCLQLISDSDTNVSLRTLFLPICLLVSVIFMVLTLFVYSCIPKLRNINGMCIMCYLAAFAIGFTLLAFVKISGSKPIAPWLCSSIAHILYVSLLSGFFWLNVINFDLWMSFGPSTGFNRMSDRKRFPLYSLYGFGLPCICVLIIAVLDRVESIPHGLRPGMGIHTCFIQGGDLVQLMYFYGVVGIIISLNIVLYILTAKRISQVQQGANTSSSSQEDSSKLKRSFDKRKENVILYLRLFIIAGISWVLEVLSFLVSSHSPYFILSDIWNCLQGVFIFILLILRRPVLKLIKEKWNYLLSGKTNPKNETMSNSSSLDYDLRLNTMPSPIQ